MKVCTDATLFGAMAPITGGEQTLDIGTGTGLLALMAAQLGASHITGVELTTQAYEDARYNFYHSAWSERLHAVHGSIQDFCSNKPGVYDLIICNPPFFHNHSKATDRLRNQARHTDALSFSELLACVDQLQRDEGLCYLLVARPALAEVCRLAGEYGFYLIGQTDFRGYSHTSWKVSALTFSRQQKAYAYDSLTIYQSDRNYTKESTRFLAPFLLRFGQSR